MAGNVELYYGAVRKRRWWRWGSSLSAALLLNALLFMLLPTLMTSSPETEALVELIPKVNVIRLQPKEEPPKKKRLPPKPEEPKKRQESLKKETKVVIPKLSMPFQLSPTMPNGPSQLELPPMEIGKFSPVGELGGVETAQLDKGLMPASQVPPIYPLRAKRRGIEGWVKVRFLVDEQGTVSSIRVIEARPKNIFEKSVFTCVKKWRFHPGTVEGMPVSVWMETTIKFELE